MVVRAEGLKRAGRRTKLPTAATCDVCTAVPTTVGPLNDWETERCLMSWPCSQTRLISFEPRCATQHASFAVPSSVQ